MELSWTSHDFDGTDRFSDRLKEIPTIFYTSLLRQYKIDKMLNCFNETNKIVDFTRIFKIPIYMKNYSTHL